MILMKGNIGSVSSPDQKHSNDGEKKDGDVDVGCHFHTYSLKIIREYFLLVCRHDDMRETNHHQSWCEIII